MIKGIYKEFIAVRIKSNPLYDEAIFVLKHPCKKGKKESRTPFDILRSYDESGDEKDANLFRLYYFAFKGTLYVKPLSRHSSIV